MLIVLIIDWYHFLKIPDFEGRTKWGKKYGCDEMGLIWLEIRNIWSNLGNTPKHMKLFEPISNTGL